MRPFSCRRALTLVEVIVAMFIMALVMGSALDGFIFTRRATEASIAQNVATNVVQGYIEQLRGLEWNANLTVFSPDPSKTAAYTAGAAGYTLATVDDLNGVVNSSPLTVSLLPVPTLNTLTATSTPPSGAVDNIRTPVINSNSNATATVTIWLWIDDQSPSSSSVTVNKRYTIVYKWTTGSGTATKTYMNSFQTMVSVIRTY